MLLISLLKPYFLFLTQNRQLECHSVNITTRIVDVKKYNCLKIPLLRVYIHLLEEVPV